MSKNKFFVGISMAIVAFFLSDGVADTAIFTLFKPPAVTSSFCIGIRQDGIRYEDFIDGTKTRYVNGKEVHVLDENSKMKLTEQERCRWKEQVAKGQELICGKSTFPKPNCNKRR